MTDWPVKTLGEVCELSTGGTPSTGNKAYYDGGQIKWLRSGDVHQREIYDCEGRITEEGMQNANTRYLPMNSVLIALAGQGKTRGTVAILRTKATCNQSVVSIMPIDTKTLLPEFVFWNLHMKYDEIRRMTGDDGNDRRGLNMRLIRSMTVPMASLEEQQRIVALLDAATARVNELEACYEQARTHASNLFTSALRDALEGNPDWPVKTLGEVATFHNGRAYKQQELLDKGKYRVLRVGNFFSSKSWYWSDLELDEHKYCDKGDLLYAWSASFGPRIWDEEKVIYHYHIWKVVEDSQQIDRQFLKYWLEEDVERVKSASGTGTTMMHVSKGSIEARSISLPSLDEQKRIIRRLDAMKAKTSEMIAAYDAKLTAAKNLRQSILEAAFAGEL
jgi:type I restriction enzyme S subunit